jgi:Uma2 family endonuclease
MCAQPLSHPGPATERDLDDLPEDVIGQIVDGELIVHPRPDAPHVITASELGAFLIAPFRRGIGGPGGWVILHEPKVRFGSQLLVPDLAGWRKERFVLPRKGPFTVIPDWVCEVLSPSTRRFDRATKLPIYAQQGVGHVWIIDPVARTLEVLRLHQAGWFIVGIHKDEDKVRAEPFEAVEIDLSLIWGELPPEPDEDEAD